MSKKNKINDPPHFAEIFANFIFFIITIFAIIFCFYSVYKIYNPPEPVSLIFYIIVLIFSLSLILLIFFIIKIKNINLKVNLALLFFTFGFSIYSFEAYLTLSKKSNNREIIAKEMNISFDKRTIMEVVQDKRNSGFKSYPNTYPLSFAKTNGFDYQDGRIYPIGTISNSTIVYCNELGFYNNFKSDKYGFNNPKEQFKNSSIDIVILGDSFAEGACVKSSDNIKGLLYKKNLNVLNFGKGSSGPLLQLAALVEYAKPLKPKIVLWLSSINDFSNLVDELHSPILTNYLNINNFSQSLILKQEIIDLKLKNYVNSQWLIEDRKNQNNLYEITIKFIKLNEFRKIFNLKPNFNSSPIFKDILIKSKDIVSNWGGKIYFVIIPDLDYAKYINNNKKNSYIWQKNLDYINKTVKELNIPIINLHKNVIDINKDPISLFSLKIGSHYNNEGYKLIAEEIYKTVSKDLIN